MTNSNTQIAKGQHPPDEKIKLHVFGRFKQGLTVREFKEKWKLSYEQVAYAIGSLGPHGLCAPSLSTVYKWSSGVNPHPPGILTLLDLISQEWSGKIQYWEHFQNMKHPVISRLAYPRDVLFLNMILPNYQRRVIKLN